MQIQCNSISIICACLLVFIGLIIDNKIEARTLSRNLRIGALRNIQLDNLAFRKKRETADELYSDDINNKTPSESSEGKDKSSSSSVEDDVKVIFDSDESEGSEDSEINEDGKRNEDSESKEESEVNEDSETKEESEENKDSGSKEDSKKNEGNEESGKPSVQNYEEIRNLDDEFETLFFSDDSDDFSVDEQDEEDEIDDKKK